MTSGAMSPALVTLPIDAHLPALVESLRHTPRLVLQASPGAGKTTRVPRAMLLERVVGDQEIWVLEPRRLATRMAAARVADELGEPLGERVGYQIRFEDVSSPRTRLRFVTEALLTRRLLADPLLKGIGAVVLDEFHERHLATDVGLALVRRLQTTARPDLVLVVMSATLDTEGVASYLDDAPTVSVDAPRFPVQLGWHPLAREQRLDAAVAQAVRRALTTTSEGDVLVFLPGSAEIRRAGQACAELARQQGVEVCTLHGDLDAREQDRVVRRAAHRRIILSTNIAETSLTLEGVRSVVDTGLARVPSFDPWSGLPTLQVRPVSQASCIQRAGRAGRLGPGLCLRLYAEHDFKTRPAAEKPELQRLELAETALLLKSAGLRALHELEWLDAPDPANANAAEALLVALGAADGRGALTPLGRELNRYPVHPRLARLVTAGRDHRALAASCAAAAVLSERDVRWETRDDVGASDVADRVRRFERARRAGFSEGACRDAGVEAWGARRIERVRQQLERVARVPSDEPVVADGEGLLRAVVAAFPDRVAKRRNKAGERAGEETVLLAAGGVARLARESVVRGSEWMVALEAEDRTVAGRGEPLVRVASELEPDWLLDLPGLAEKRELAWNDRAGRVEVTESLCYGALTLDASTRPAEPSDETARLVSKAAKARGAAASGVDELERLLARLAIVQQVSPREPVEALLARPPSELFDLACVGCASLADFDSAPPAERLLQQLEPSVRAELADLAPERMRLAHGRELQVNYERGKPPWVESWLQDFFGTARGPTIARGRVSVTLHLLAPNRRPIQVTSDLASFWRTHYYELRPALSRRYPRHAWPEDPLKAAPPPPKARRP